MSDEPTDAMAAAITPPGEGGIGVIALSGVGAVEVLAACFEGTHRAAEEIAPGVIAHGRIVRDGRTVDEVIVAHLAAEESHTGEALYEVNCHGGAAATAAVLECLHAAGAQVVPWQAFCSTADLRAPVLSEAAIRASALGLLPRARTRLAARMLLCQAQGALGRALDDVRTQLLAGSAAALHDLLATSPLGRALLRAPKVMLGGPPNAGKSTLLNALLRRERVIVHEEPGTTRDVVCETVSLGGVPFELMDCAGLGPEAEPLAQAAAGRAAALLARCDVLLLVYDVQVGVGAALEALPALPGRARTIAVGNKIDLLADAPCAEPLLGALAGVPHILVSAREGRNIEQVEAALLEPYAQCAAACERRCAVVFTEQIHAALAHVADVLSERDARAAAEALGELLDRSDPAR